MKIKNRLGFIFLVIAFLLSAVLPSVPSQSGSVSSNTDDLGLTVYFIDVEQADAALVISDGYTMLIDGGNPSDSDLIYTFLKNRDIKP